MLVILLAVFVAMWLPFIVALLYAEYRHNRHHQVRLSFLTRNTIRISGVPGQEQDQDFQGWSVVPRGKDPQTSAQGQLC